MILDMIALSTRNRVELAKKRLPIDSLREIIREKTITGAHSHRGAATFTKALKKDGLSFICEIKKASPSRGVISEDFPYEAIAAEYEAAGADAVSVLTEPNYFMGSNEYLERISSKIRLPILQKDFIIDEYQLYEARAIGADAVLLICALLTVDELYKYLEICRELDLAALVEIHTQDEAYMALRAGAVIIGGNNRNLKTFEVNIGNSLRLRRILPRDIVYVAESGIKSTEDIKELKAAGADAVLIGELLMKSSDRQGLLSELKAAGNEGIKQPDRRY